MEKYKWWNIFGGIIIALGLLGMSYGTMSDTSYLLTIGIGVYLLVNAEKIRKK